MHMAVVIISIVVRCAVESAAPSLQGPKIISLAIPPVPGVLGNPAPQLDELVAFRVQRQGLVGLDLHPARRTLHNCSSVKYLDVNLGRIQVDSEMSAFIELDLGALGFKFANVPTPQIDVEGSITAFERQPVQFRPRWTQQGQLLEEEFRVLPQAGGRAVFKLHLGEAVPLGSKQKTFLDGIVKACRANALAGGLKGNLTLNESEPNDANLRHIVLGRQRGECRNCQDRRPNYQSVKSFSHSPPPLDKHLNLIRVDGI